MNIKQKIAMLSGLFILLGTSPIYAGGGGHGGSAGGGISGRSESQGYQHGKEESSEKFGVEGKEQRNTPQGYLHGKQESSEKHGLEGKEEGRHLGDKN